MYNPKVKSCICNNNKLLLNYPPDGHLERVGCEHDDRKELHWRGSHWQAKLLVSRLSWAWSDAQIWGNYPIILSHRKRFGFGFGAVSVGPGKMPVCLLWVDLRKLPQHCQRKRFRFMPLPLSVQLVWGKWEVILHTGKCRSGQEQLTTTLTSVWGDLSITLASTTNFGFIVCFLNFAITVLPPNYYASKVLILAELVISNDASLLITGLTFEGHWPILHCRQFLSQHPCHFIHFEN